MKLLENLRERRLAQFLGAYAAGSWLVLEAVDQFVGRGLLPDVIYPLTLTLILCGIPVAIITSWFHGAKGSQQMPPLEKWLLTAVAALALITSGFVVRSHRAAARAAVAPLEALAPTEDPRRVAVLYFEDRSPSGEAGFLSAGLTEALIDELSAVEALHVVSRNGVALFRGETVAPDSIARALEVGTLVEGTVTESESLIRVNVSLVSASTGEQFASSRLERPRAELFELQEDIASEVALFLREELGEEIELIERHAGTDNVDAWVLLQQADESAEEANRLAGLDDAEAAVRRLLEADSLLAGAEELAPDWVTPTTQRGWLAYRQSRLGGFDRSHSDLIETGMGHAERAVQLAPRDPDALELRATLHYWRYLLNLVSTPGEAEVLFAEAEADFRASVASNPEQASAWGSLSHLLLNKGQTAEAKLAAQRSYEGDPYLRNANVTLWRLFFSSLDLEDAVEARKWCDVGRRRFAEDHRFRECQVWLYSLKNQQPNIEHAWGLCAEWVALSPPGVREHDEKKCQVLIGMALVRAGLPDSARSVLERARVGADIDPVRELSWFEAIARSWLGDTDEALDLLATYLAANPGQRESFATDRTWWLAELRADPRYQSLVGG